MSMAVITSDPDQQKHWTAAELRAIPDDRNRYEIVDGELLVTPAPVFSHQRLVVQIFRHLDRYLSGTSIGELVISPADIELADDTVVQPDVFVVPLVDGVRPRNWRDVTGLLLAIEVLSPSTARADRTVKRRRYQREGVPEYWIVDGDARVVERWRPEEERPEMMSDWLEWQPDQSVAALAIDVAKLFTDALGPSLG